jgi:hypothetical protein
VVKVFFVVILSSPSSVFLSLIRRGRDLKIGSIFSAIHLYGRYGPGSRVSLREAVGLCLACRAGLL